VYLEDGLQRSGVLPWKEELYDGKKALDEEMYCTDIAERKRRLVKRR
jgi:hypothetical protein